MKFSSGAGTTQVDELDPDILIGFGGEEFTENLSRYVYLEFAIFPQSSLLVFIGFSTSYLCTGAITKK